jgi:hypothetical protein
MGWWVWEVGRLLGGRGIDSKWRCNQKKRYLKWVARNIDEINAIVGLEL